MSDYVVRRLMPVECERLQGFPSGWTDIHKKIVKKKDGTSKAVEVEEPPEPPRSKALGNSMPVSVLRRIGERNQRVEERR